MLCVLCVCKEGQPAIEIGHTIELLHGTEVGGVVRMGCVTYPDREGPECQTSYPDRELTSGQSSHGTLYVCTCSASACVVVRCRP